MYLLLSLVLLGIASYGKDTSGSPLEYTNRKSLLSTQNERISVGIDAKTNQFPWMALLSLPGGTCGGVLISPRHVLTAAHCLKPFTVDALISEAKVTIGLVDVNDVKCSGCEISGIKEVFINPEYNPSAFKIDNSLKISGDIAIIRLKSKSDILPAKLGKLKPRPKDLSLVMGWGATANGSPKSDVLQVGVVETLPADICSGKRPKDFFDKSASICTGSGPERPANGLYTSTACAGDSGSPMVDEKEPNVVLGVVSYSILPSAKSTCGEYSNTVFTSVADYLPWIFKVMSRE